MSWPEDIDWQAQAQIAMKMAAATTGLERLKWVQVAQAWHDLAAARVRFSNPLGLKAE